jgi:hypothetical protein
MRGILRFKSTRWGSTIFQITEASIQGASLQRLVCYMYKTTLQYSIVYDSRFSRADQMNGESSIWNGSRNRRRVRGNARKAYTMRDGSIS